MNTNRKTSKTPKPFTSVISQEVTHYDVEFANWLKKNVSIQASRALFAITFLSLVERYGVTEQGQKEVERSRRTLKKFCTKYTPRKAA